MNTGVGGFIYTYRMNNRMSRRDLAVDMVHNEGIDPRDDLLLVEAYEKRIYRWEHGIQPSLYSLRSLKQALKCSYDDLLGDPE